METDKLEYSKTPEEERREREFVDTAEYFLKHFGVKTKTDYGYYRNTWDILKDLGEYLVESNICKAHSTAAEAVARICTIEEDMFMPEQVRKMTKEEVRKNYKKIIESMKYWD